MKNEIVREMMTPEQLKDIAAIMIGAIPKLRFEEAERIIASKGKFVADIQKVFEFLVWKTIQLGNFATANEFRRALKNGGFRISNWANDIMGMSGFTMSSEMTELALVRVTVAELGFPKGAPRKKIYERAQALGLELCPAEAGPQLRMQYRDQPNRERLIIAMEPIKISDGDPCVFRVGRDDDDLWLYAYYGYPDLVWSPDGRWVFALRK